MDAARRRRDVARLALSGLFAALVATGVTYAWQAAPALAKPATAAVAAPSLDIEVWPDHQRGLSTFIVLARLPQGTRLPAKVLVPLPKGSTITWSGEIDENSASGDTTIPVTYTTLPGGGRAMQLTANRFPSVQYEAVIGPVARQDGRVTATLAWVQTVPAGLVTFSSRAPIAATDVVMNPAAAGDPQTDTSLGQKLYTVEPQRPAVGASIPFTISYTMVGAGSQGAGAAAGGVAGQTWAWFVALVIALGVAMALMVWSSRRRARAAAPTGADGRDDGDDA